MTSSDHIFGFIWLSFPVHGSNKIETYTNGGSGAYPTIGVDTLAMSSEQPQLVMGGKCEVRLTIFSCPMIQG